MENKLVEILRSLSEKTVRLLTSDVILRRGYEYFFQRKMISLKWDHTGNALIAYVRGTTTYQVKIMYEDDDFSVGCNCPAWDEDELCKHAACALLTISNVLHNKNLDQTTSNFLQVLLSGAAEKPADSNQPLTLRLVPHDITRLYSNPTFTIEFFHGMRKLTEADVLSGSNFAKLMHQRSWYHNFETLLTSFLDEDHNNIIIEMQTLHGLITLSWDNKHQAVARVDIASGKDDSLSVRCIAQQDDGIFIEDLIRVSQKLVVDVQNRRLMRVYDDAPWLWAEKITKNMLDAIDLFRESDLLSFTGHDVNVGVPLVFEESSREMFKQTIRFKKNNVTIVPQQEVPTNIVQGFIDTTKNLIRLEPQFVIDNQSTSVLLQVLMGYVHGIDRWLKPWLRTKSRRAMIIQCLFDLIKVDNAKEAKELATNLIKELKKSYQGYTGNSGIKEYIESYYRALTDKRFLQVIVVNQHFYEVHLDYKSLWRTSALVASFFNEATLDDKTTSLCFIMPLDRFYDKFYAFSNLLEQESIQLRFNNKRVETIKVDVKVDASRGSESRWFDLDPQLEAEGIPLSDEQRDLLFAYDGKLETADCIKILDPQSREIIKLLAHIFKPSDEIAEAKNIKQIVQLPRLRILDLLALRKSGATVKLSDQDEALMQRLMHVAKIDPIPLPQAFKGELRDYQKAGYYWLSFLYQHRFGACLADDMGLGKTIQVIAFLGGLKEHIIPSHNATKAPHLIVVPPTLVFNWEQELYKFYPDIKVLVYTGKSSDQTFDGYDVVLTTYDRVRIDIEHLKEFMFHLLIFDEAQAIKNIYAARTAAVRQLRSHFTICLTGTPLENHLGEYHSIVDLALPGLLSDYKKFMKSVQADQHQDLIKRTRPFVLRRTKDAILKELPPKVESNVVLTMSEQQQKVYATTVAEVKRLIDQAYQTKTSAQANVIALTAILRLRQICISAELIDGNKEHESPKINHLMTSLGELVQEGSAALVFSQFTKCLDLLESALKKEGLSYYRIDGSTSMAQRRVIVESFQSGQQNVSILLLSLKTGGVGLNLTRANYVFHVDPWWNPSVENQASDRAHRMGQVNTVFVSRLIMHGTIEEKMMALKEKKLKLFNEVVEHAENKTKGFISKQDFDALLS